MQADGYSLDDKRSEIKHNDIPDIVARYQKLKSETKRSRTDQSFLVPFAEIKANDWDLSINRYKEVVYEQVQYTPPKQLIAEIKQLDKERLTALKKLEELLG